MSKNKKRNRFYPGVLSTKSILSLPPRAATRLGLRKAPSWLFSEDINAPDSCFPWAEHLPNGLVLALRGLEPLEFSAISEMLCFIHLPCRTDPVTLHLLGLFCDDTDPLTPGFPGATLVSMTFNPGAHSPANVKSYRMLGPNVANNHWPETWARSLDAQVKDLIGFYEGDNRHEKSCASL